jgi:hypothetical protein
VGPDRGAEREYDPDNRLSHNKNIARAAQAVAV